MTELRNDSRVFGCGLSVLASTLFCFAAATAAADDLEPASDPLIAAIDAFIAELNLDKSDKKWKSKVPAPDATAAFDLGVALQDLGRHGAAIEAYRLAVEIDPDCADAYFNLAVLYEGLGEKAAAIHSLKSYRSLRQG